GVRHVARNARQFPFGLKVRRLLLLARDLVLALGALLLAGTAHHATHHATAAHRAAPALLHPAVALLLLVVLFTFLDRDSVPFLVQGKDHEAAAAGVGVWIAHRDQLGLIADQAGTRFGSDPGPCRLELVRVQRHFDLIFDQ